MRATKSTAHCLISGNYFEVRQCKKTLNKNQCCINCRSVSLKSKDHKQKLPSKSFMSPEMP